MLVPLIFPAREGAVARVGVDEGRKTSKVTQTRTVVVTIVTQCHGY